MKQVQWLSGNKPELSPEALQASGEWRCIFFPLSPPPPESERCSGQGHAASSPALASLGTDALSAVDGETVNIIDTKKLRVIWILQDTHRELQIPLI